MQDASLRPPAQCSVLQQLTTLGSSGNRRCCRAQVSGNGVVRGPVSSNRGPEASTSKAGTPSCSWTRPPFVDLLFRADRAATAPCKPSRCLWGEVSELVCQCEFGLAEPGNTTRARPSPMHVSKMPDLQRSRLALQKAALSSDPCRTLRRCLRGLSVICHQGGFPMAQGAPKILPGTPPPFRRTCKATPTSFARRGTTPRR